LLPSSEKFNARRTVPIKFNLHISPSVDPDMPFVRNEELDIRIYHTGVRPENLMQTSQYGDGSRDYRINMDSEHYITNFKTDIKPKKYIVEIWRIINNFDIGTFEFETYKK
jgi:hypothetical protein